jgi:NTE family protein
MAIDPLTSANRPKTAFVLAGGGSLGVVQVGMLRALTAFGLRPDLVVGSSVGAINSVFYAARPTLEGVGELESIWRSLRRPHVFPLSITGVALGLLGRRPNMLSPAALQRLLQSRLPVSRLEETIIPACVVATDILRGSEVRLTSGPAVPALLASTAIPGLFPPVHIDGHLLVDGAAANHTPISAALALGATRIVVLPAGFPCAKPDAPRGALPMALHGLNILTANQLARDVERYCDLVEVVVVPPLCPLVLPSYDFTGAGEVIGRAAGTTTAWLESGGLQRPSDRGQLAPHHHM